MFGWLRFRDRPTEPSSQPTPILATTLTPTLTLALALALTLTHRSTTRGAALPLAPT